MHSYEKNLNESTKGIMMEAPLLEVNSSAKNNFLLRVLKLTLPIHCFF